MLIGTSSRARSSIRSSNDGVQARVHGQIAWHLMIRLMIGPIIVCPKLDLETGLLVALFLRHCLQIDDFHLTSTIQCPHCSNCQE
jgi:hypothetical protein